MTSVPIAEAKLTLFDRSHYDPTLGRAEISLLGDERGYRFARFFGIIFVRLFHRRLLFHLRFFGIRNFPRSLLFSFYFFGILPRLLLSFFRLWNFLGCLIFQNFSRFLWRFLRSCRAGKISFFRGFDVREIQAFLHFVFVINNRRRWFLWGRCNGSCFILRRSRRFLRPDFSGCWSIMSFRLTLRHKSRFFGTVINWSNGFGWDCPLARGFTAAWPFQGRKIIRTLIEWKIEFAYPVTSSEMSLR